MINMRERGSESIRMMKDIDVSGSSVEDERSGREGGRGEGVEKWVIGQAGL